MLVLRPVTMRDIDGIIELVGDVTFGLTTLPPDREHLAKRVRASERAFGKDDDPSPGGESYLFVLADDSTGKVVGASGIVSKVGGFEPFYAYRLETVVTNSAQLNVQRDIDTLHLVTEHNGPTEIGSLFLHPEYRGGGTGRLLSLGRFLFMGSHRACFDDQVIAEMRGVIDDKGVCPFWDGLARHFIPIEYAQADHLSVKDKRFIADLMPRHPIYIPLLPARTRDVIGHVHPDTAPALQLLEQEGFQFNMQVDIFEAGPIVECATNNIRTIRETQRAMLKRIEPIEEGALCLISNGRRDFTACRSKVRRLDDEHVALPSTTADALGVQVGDHVCYVTMNPDNK